MFSKVDDGGILVLSQVLVNEEDKEERAEGRRRREKRREIKDTEPMYQES